MPKLKNNKKMKSHLTAEEKQMGKTSVYILLGMIVVGIVIGLYNMQ